MGVELEGPFPLVCLDASNYVQGYVEMAWSLRRNYKLMGTCLVLRVFLVLEAAKQELITGPLIMHNRQLII